MIQTCDAPPLDEMKAMDFESGDQRGRESEASPRVSCRGSPPASGSRQMWLTILFASSSGVETTYAIHLPSGETCGSEIRWIFIRSSKVSACLGWARTGRAANERTKKTTGLWALRFISGPHRIGF